MEDVAGNPGGPNRSGWKTLWNKNAWPLYAVALSLALLGQGDGINLALAWAYVGIRVVHSLLQALINKIELRFVLFTLSSLALVGLAANALWAVL